MLTIRNATVADAAAVAELARQLGHPETTAALVTSNLGELARDGDGTALVALDEHGAVCGFARGITQRFVVAAPFAELAALVVDAKARSRGVGKALLEAVERWARDGGYDKLVIRSNVIRTRAHRFYLREGCAERKRQVVFEKPL